jgi:hypothetical protein
MSREFLSFFVFGAKLSYHGHKHDGEGTRKKSCGIKAD